MESYAATEIKKSLVGVGRATKAQVQRMAQQRLGLAEPPEPEDFADAVAAAYCPHRQKPPEKRPRRRERGVIRRVRGEILEVAGESAVLQTPAGLAYEVQVGGYALPELQALMDAREAAELHTYHYLEGNVATGQLLPRLAGLPVGGGAGVFPVLHQGARHQPPERDAGR